MNHAVNNFIRNRKTILFQILLRKKNEYFSVDLFTFETHGSAVCIFLSLFRSKPYVAGRQRPIHSYAI